MSLRSFVRSFARSHVKIIFGDTGNYTSTREKPGFGKEGEAEEERGGGKLFRIVLGSEMRVAAWHGSLSRAPAKRNSCHGHSQRLSFAAVTSGCSRSSRDPFLPRGKRSQKNDRA